MHRSNEMINTQIRIVDTLKRNIAFSTSLAKLHVLGALGSKPKQNKTKTKNKQSNKTPVQLIFSSVTLEAS